MKIKQFKRFGYVLVIVLAFIPLSGRTQNAEKKSVPPKIVLGSYYFDGWNNGSHHITDKLKEHYQNREPISGWVTSKATIVDAQINEAANAGISFFSFDWYFRDGSDDYPLNHALNLYLSSQDKSRLKFCLMVANHTPFFIGPDNWSDASKIWIKLFKDKGYLKVNKMPLLIFFSVPSLVKQFGSTAAVKKAFNSLRDTAQKEGLRGVSIAACVYDNVGDIRDAEACGFDIITGYNYHDNGLEKEQEVTPIDSMRVADIRVWNGIKNKSDLPYIPVATLNWDPRPWRPDTVLVPHFSGYSMQSVYHAVKDLKQWIRENRQRTTKEKVALMYAWNENGEGGWLTPSKILKDSLLMGVKKALIEKAK